jgi:hypothetical protein
VDVPFGSQFMFPMTKEFEKQFVGHLFDSDLVAQRKGPAKLQMAKAPNNFWKNIPL